MEYFVPLLPASSPGYQSDNSKGKDMSDYEKLLYIINNEFYQLRDRLQKSGLDNAMILMVCDGIKAKALDDVNAVLMSKLADVEREMNSDSSTDCEVD